MPQKDEIKIAAIDYMYALIIDEGWDRRKARRKAERKYKTKIKEK